MFNRVETVRVLKDTGTVRVLNNVGIVQYV